MTTTGAAPRAGQGGDEGEEIARLQVLSTVWSVVDHASGMQDDIPALWARCATEAAPTRVMRLLPAGETAPATDPSPDQPARLPEETLTVTDEQSGYRFASRVISSSIAEHVGRALMLHAGALTVPGGDRAVALVAASGTGKTTASRVLAQQGWGYLTDECVAVGEDLTVQPLAKPLSVVTDPAAGGHLKHQVGPDELGMAEPGESAVLAGMVLLDRIRSDEQAAEELREGPLPRTESLGLVEALTHLAPQTSALSRTPGGLGRLAREVQRVGVHRLVYREIEECTGVLEDLVAAGQPEVEAFEELTGEAAWDARPAVPAQEEPRPTVTERASTWRRSAFSQAVVTGTGEAVVMVGSSLVVLGPVGAVVWESLATACREVDLLKRVVGVLGEHPRAERLTADALTALWRQGLVEPA